MILRYQTPALVINPFSLGSHGLTSPQCLPYSSHDVSLESLVLDHLIIAQLMFPFIFNTCLLDIVMILWGEILFLSLVGVKGLRNNKFKVATLLNSIYSLLLLYSLSNNGKNSLELRSVHLKNNSLSHNFQWRELGKGGACDVTLN